MKLKKTIKLFIAVGIMVFGTQAFSGGWHNNDKHYPMRQSTVKAGWDYPGLDYRHFKTYDGAKQCMRSCLGDMRCQAWTYLSPEDRAIHGHCWLKYSASRGYQGFEGRISGIVY